MLRAHRRKRVGAAAGTLNGPRARADACTTLIATTRFQLHSFRFHPWRTPVDE
jgi:hypothetical protein